MGVHQQGYYTTHITASAAPSESQAALVTFAVTDTRKHTRSRAHTAQFFHFFILHECVTNLSVLVNPEEPRGACKQSRL